MRSFNKLYKELMESVIWQPKVTIPLGIKRDDKESGFKEDNPLIRKFALSNPDNLAMVFAFVFYTMQTPWAEVLHGFPKFIEWFYTKAVVRKGNRLVVNRNVEPPSFLGHQMTGKHKETGLSTQRLSQFYDVYDNRQTIYENVVKRIDDVFELFDYVTTIKGLAKAKAAFVVQLISGDLGCFDSINVKSYDVTGLNMASPARDKHGKLTKGGRKNLESYIEYSSPMSQILWDDWCEIVENKFLYAGKFSKEEKARDEHKVIATKKGDNIKYQTSYTPNKRTKDRLEKYTNERLKGSKIDGRNVSRDHRTIFNDIEPFIRKEAVEQIIESVGGYIPSMMTKQQRQVIVDSIKNKTLSRKDTIQALTKINPSDMMAITEKLDTNTLKYLAGMTDKSRTETLSFLRRGINKIKDNMHSSTNKSPMTDDVMIRKPVDITARKVVVDPYTESFNHQYKMLMKEYVEDFDQKWDKAVSESEELQVALDLMKNIKKKLKGEIYIVGGVPRDLLMGNAIDDVDLATNIPVEQLEKHFELRNISKNDSQPVYAILWKGYVYDLAKFRTDSGDIGRQANVSTETDSFQADTERRDLTINSFGLDENGKIVDYQGGLDDLKNKIVRAVGDAKKRFMEDATRILRVFRFAAKMDFEIEDDTKKAAIELKYLLQDPKAISKESISKEFYKSAKTGRTLANFLKKLQDTKILHDILPEFTEMEGFDHDPQHHPEGDSQVLGHIYECLNASPYKDPIINLAVLFHDFGKATTRGKKDNGFSSYHGHEAAGVPIVEGIFERLRFNELSQQDKKNILAAVDKHMLVHNLDKLNIKTLTRLIQNPAWETIKAVGYCDEASRGSGLFDEKEFWDKVKRAEEKVSNIGGSEDETRKRLKQYFSGNKLMEWFPVLIKDKSKFKDITAALQEYTLEELNAGREPDDTEMKTIVAGILKKNQFNEWYNYYQKN